MIVRAWRIIKDKHAATAFTGGGAKTYGGRWNSPGTAVVYTAGSLSLAILETLVHLQVHELMGAYVMFEISFDEAAVETVAPAALPKTWVKSPPPPAAQKIGDEWVSRGSSAILRLPSVVVPSESNYLLNPNHPDFAKITISAKQRITLDPRLIKPRAK